MNSTFLECVDKFFEARGIITAVGLIGIGFSLILLTAFTSVGLANWLVMPPEEKRVFLWAGLFVYVLLVPLFFFCLRYVLLKESFCFTHYPMRFNRKNRMVYVFRKDGTVMTEPWDRLFFALGDCGEGIYDIRMHRLDAAGDGLATLETRELMHRLSSNMVKVLETHALSHYTDKNDPNLTAQWEFIRQYMENGPAPFMDDITLVLDVAERRESLIDGFRRMHSSSIARMGALGYLVLPVDIAYALGRWIANLTSKIPRWPEEVERECRIAPDDPYIRDRNNLATQAEFWDAQERCKIS